MAEEKRKRILSGIQPTGTPTLGNYIGAVRNWALLQSDYDCLYMVADLHSLTVRQVPADLRRRTRELAALLLAVQGQERQAPRQRQRRPVHLPCADGGGYPDL